MDKICVNNQNYCYGCLCKIIGKPLNLYNFRNNVLIGLLQVKQLPLCTHCTKRANQSEYFIQNVQENQTLLENAFNITESTIKEAHINYNPLHNCSITKLNPIQLSGVDEIEIPLVNKAESDSVDTKVKIEIYEDDYGVEICDNFIEDDNVNEIKEAIKQEILDEDEFPLEHFKEPQLKKSKKTRMSKREQEPWLSGVKVKQIKISTKQCMKEMEDARNDEKFSNKLWKCTSCVKGFSFKGSYDQHMEKHSEKSGNFECHICKQRYQTEDKMIEHKKYHLTRYKCPKCDYVRIIRESVRDHYTSFHCNETINYQCQICSKVFNCYIYYKKHINNTHKAQRLKCTYCNKVLKGRGSLNNHQMRMHPDKVPSAEKPCPFICEDCGASFTSPSKLKIHSVKHSNSREFYCVECDKSFKTEFSLKTHLTTAQPHISHLELPFSCTHCGKKFASKRNYLKHMDLHMDRKPFKCDKCNKTYLNNWNLKNHYKLAHEGYKRPLNFPCPMCDKVFDRNCILKSHIRTHTGERPYQCTKCSSTFTQRSSLGTHMKLVHLKLTRDGKPKNALKI